MHNVRAQPYVALGVGLLRHVAFRHFDLGAFTCFKGRWALELVEFRGRNCINFRLQDVYWVTFPRGFGTLPYYS